MALGCGHPDSEAYRHPDGKRVSCRACRRAKRVDYKTPEWLAAKAAQRLALKAEVLAAYGGVCACCGEAEVAFLVIDHVDGGGTKHRKEIGGASRLLAWLKRHGYPVGFQLLCCNCNHAKQFNPGGCPHQMENKHGDPGSAVRAGKCVVAQTAPPQS